MSSGVNAREFEEWFERIESVCDRVIPVQVAAEQSAFDSETIAAFVEGRLDDNDRAQFEEECRLSDHLLQEVVSTFLFNLAELRQSFDSDQLANVDDDSKDRVLAKLDLGFVQSALNEDIQAHESTIDNKSNLGATVATKTATHSNRFEKPTTTHWIHHAFQLTLVLAVLLAIFYSIQDPNRNAPTHAEVTTESKPKDEAKGKQADDESNSIQHTINPQVVAKGNKNHQTQLRDNFPESSQQRPIRCIVHQVEGVAIKKNIDGRWVGGLASNGKETAAIATLPSSMLRAHLQDFASIIVGPQTTFRLNRESKDSTVNIELGHGELELSELAAHSELRLFLARKRCDLKVGPQPTKLLLDYVFGGLHIKVGQGSVTVVHDNQIYELNPKTSIVVGLANIARLDSPGKNPNERQVIPQQRKPSFDQKFGSLKKRDQVLNTDDLESLLQEWQGREPLKSKLLLHSICLAADPDSEMFQFLHGSATQRRVAFDWLTSVTYQSKSYQTVMNVLRKKFGPTEIRSFSASIKLIMYQQNGRQNIFPAVVQTILKGLSHDSIAIRQASDLAFQKLTQSSVGFDPESGKQAWAEAIERWKLKLKDFKFPEQPKARK